MDLVEFILEIRYKLGALITTPYRSTTVDTLIG